MWKTLIGQESPVVLEPPNLIDKYAMCKVLRKGRLPFEKC